MKFSGKGLAIAIGLSILISLHVLMGIYVYANIVDYKIDLLNLNPSEKSNMRNFPIMTYPPSTGSGFQFGNNTIVFENIYLKYNGTPSENQPLELSAMGTLDPSFAQQIQSVSFYFEGASPYPVSGTFTGSWGITLYPTNETGHGGAIFFGALLVGDPTVITWQVQGDYYPSITIYLTNHTDIAQSYATYQDFRMHIESSDVLRQQTSNRISNSVSIALLFLAILDVPTFVGRFYIKRRSGSNGETIDDSSKQSTNKPETKSNKGKPDNKIRKRKVKTKKQGENQR